MDSTRRDWILGTLGSVASTAIASAQEHAHQAIQRGGTSEFNFFDTSTAADISAITAQILPSNDGPGAREAGVVFFIDRALCTFDEDKQELYRRGMSEFRDISKKMYPDSTGIAALSNEQQFELVLAIEKSEFFEVLRIHTMLGFLGSPSYGGNRDGVGWKYIGFEDRMAWTPPFGYYDRQPQ
jgi:gluconate 2-dehydrogenase gamma chain